MGSSRGASARPSFPRSRVRDRSAVLLLLVHAHTTVVHCNLLPCDWRARTGARDLADWPVAGGGSGGCAKANEHAGATALWINTAITPQWKTGLRPPNSEQAHGRVSDELAGSPRAPLLLSSMRPKVKQPSQPSQQARRVPPPPPAPAARCRPPLLLLPLLAAVCCLPAAAWLPLPHTQDLPLTYSTVSVALCLSPPLRCAGCCGSPGTGCTRRAAAAGGQATRGDAVHRCTTRLCAADPPAAALRPERRQLRQRRRATAAARCAGRARRRCGCAAGGRGGSEPSSRNRTSRRGWRRQQQ